VSATDTVRAGDTFTVSFRTLTKGCDQPDVIGEQTSASGENVTLTPYNVDITRQDSNSMCPTYITTSLRSIDISLGAPGVDTIKVVGYLRQSNDSTTLGSIQKTVQVTPK